MSTIARVRGHFRRCVQTLARLERDIIRELELERAGGVPDSLNDLPESGQVENQSEVEADTEEDEVDEVEPTGRTREPAGSVGRSGTCRATVRRPRMTTRAMRPSWSGIPPG